jgi:hypothetical protein
MNWAFFDIVQEGFDKGYKAKWAIYRAEEFGIPLTIDDLKELGEMHGFKTMWAYYMAKEFGIPIKPGEAQEKPNKPKYPDQYFMGISNRRDLKKAFRDWSKKLHPDFEHGNQDEFIKMMEQYDSMKRRMG